MKKAGELARSGENRTYSFLSLERPEDEFVDTPPEFPFSEVTFAPNKSEYKSDAAVNKEDYFEYNGTEFNHQSEGVVGVEWYHEQIIARDAARDAIEAKLICKEQKSRN